MRVLAIGAHPDDIEIGCGGTLVLFKRKGYELYALVLTKGEASGDPSLREEECRKAAGIIGVDELIFGGLQDTKISDGIETIMVIENVINRIKPNFILAHSWKDGHQDHRNAGLATLSAGRNSKKILLYESPAALRDFCPQVFVDIGTSFDVKLKALKCFNSQANKVYFKENSALSTKSFPRIFSAVQGLARFRGFQAGVIFAEAFEVGKLLLEF